MTLNKSLITSLSILLALGLFASSSTSVVPVSLASGQSNTPAGLSVFPYPRTTTGDATFTTFVPRPMEGNGASVSAATDLPPPTILQPTQQLQQLPYPYPYPYPFQQQEEQSLQQQQEPYVYGNRMLPSSPSSELPAFVPGDTFTPAIQPDNIILPPLSPRVPLQQPLVANDNGAGFGFPEIPPANFQNQYLLGQQVNETMLAGQGSLPLIQQQQETQDDMSLLSALKAGDKVPNRFIVVLKDGSSLDSQPKPDNSAPQAPSEAAADAQSKGAEVRHVYNYAIKGFAIKVPNQEVLEAIQKNPNIAYIEQDTVIKVFTSNLPPGGEFLPTGIDRSDGDLSPTRSGDGTGTVDADIAILDTGIAWDHPDLNVFMQGSFIPGVSTGYDDNGHGTHVAGIAAAMDNGVGLVGMAPGARLWAFKVLDSTGSGFSSSAIAAVDEVTANSGEIDVVNMSFGGEYLDPAFDEAITNSVSAGVTYVASAGNSGRDAITFSPAHHSDVITVSALADSDGKCGGTGAPTSAGADDSFYTFSNFGSVVDIAAPGVDILSTYLNGQYASATGTSMASPHIAGAAALYKSINPLATPLDIRNALLQSGSNPTTTCDGRGHGYFSGDRDGIAEPLLYFGLGGSQLSPTVLTLNAVPNVGPNKPLVVSGVLKDTGGAPLSGKTISFEGTTGTTSVPAPVITASDGKFTASSTTTGTGGQHTVAALYSGDGSTFEGSSDSENYIVDSVKPSVSITSPANGAVITPAPATSITIQATAADKLLSTSTTNDGKIARVSYYFKPSSSTIYTLLSTDTTSPYSSTMSNVPAGKYTLLARATDAAGNTQYSASTTITVISSSVLTINSIPTTGANKPLTISGILKDATTNAGIAGKTIAFTSTTGTTAVPSSVTTTSDGTFKTTATAGSAQGQFIVRAQFAGDSSYKSSSATRIYYVDITKPTVSLTSPANGATFTAGSPITLGATASDKMLSTSTTNDGKIKHVSFYYKQSTATAYTLIATDTTSPFNTAWSAPATAGTYNLIARATDVAGNAQYSSVRSVTVR